MKRLFQWACGLALLLCASPASATPVLVDGTWHQFDFQAAGSSVTSCGGCAPTSSPLAEQLSTPPWTFSGPATLTVLDLFLIGDRFEAFDFGVSLGTTSVVANTGLSPCFGDISCALANLGYSRLVLDLGAGAHSLTMNVIQNAATSSGGAAVFQLSSAVVPEPGTMLLFAAAFAATGVRVRRGCRVQR